MVYGAEVSLNMTNVGGSSYTATIPASAYGAEDMVRWRVTATDLDGNDSVAPPFLDQVGNNQVAGILRHRHPGSLGDF